MRQLTTFNFGSATAPSKRVQEGSPITRQYSRFVGEFVVSLAFARFRTMLDKSLI
jgi:hypothetical protein